MKNKLKFFFSFFIITIIILASLYCYIKLSNINSFIKLQQWFTQSLYGYLLYTVIVIIQIMFIPVSSLVLIVPAIMIFGAFTSFILTLIAFIIGSILAYLIGLKFSNVVGKIINSNNKISKWTIELQKNNKFYFPYFSIIPIFPDEIICLIAGITKINFWFFLCVTIISRIVHLVFICFLGAVIPMKSWWLLLWLIILIIITWICLLLNKSSTKINALFKKES